MLPKPGLFEKPVSIPHQVRDKLFSGHALADGSGGVNSAGMPINPSRSVVNGRESAIASVFPTS
jgi:hypothetical protein